MTYSFVLVIYRSKRMTSGIFSNPTFRNHSVTLSGIFILTIEDVTMPTKPLREAESFPLASDDWAKDRGILDPSGTMVVLKASNNLSEISNKAGARHNLGLTIGIDVQPFSNKLSRWSVGNSPSDFTLNAVSQIDAVGWRSYLGAGTVTQVSALVIGATGSDISSSIVNANSTPVITLNIPTASATTRGALSSQDWTLFNNKQNTLLSGTTIKTIGGTSVLGSGNIAVVTSVNVSGGTTGLTVSGGPITGSGSLTLGGVLNTASGGTGVTSLDDLKVALSLNNVNNTSDMDKPVSTATQNAIQALSVTVQTAAEQSQEVWNAWGASVDQINDWSMGTPTGGPSSNGYYPMTNRDNETVLVPCPALVFNQFSTELTGISDLVAGADSAYLAQQYSENALASALSSRLSAAMSFPSDFLDGSKFWTGGNGQIADPTVSANNPLPGTFHTISGEGVVYRTLANPESCDSFGPIGYIKAKPGQRVYLKSRFRCIENTTNGVTNTNTGLSMLPLDENFSLINFTVGSGLGHVTVEQGYREIEWTFTTPPDTDPEYGVFYRPTLFYNVVGSQSPLSPSLDTQGNARFEFSYFEIKVLESQTAGGVGVSPVVTYYSSGSGTYTTPENTSYLVVKIRGAGGGGSGSGPSAGTGEDGGNTTFGSYIAGGGKKGTDGSGGSASGGWKNIPGQAGVPGITGFYEYSPGGRGGGAYGGTSQGSTPGSNGNLGSGGGGAGSDAGAGTGYGGGEGGYVEVIITSPDPTYSYSVGTGGVGGVAGTDGRPGGNGGNGYIEVEAH